MTSSYADDDAEWINVSAPVGSDGAINAINTKSYAGFVVVRKGYEHPEIAMKIVNVNSEYAMQDNTDAAKEIKENQSIAYFNWPLYCQVQPGNNAELMTEHIKAVVDGTADASTLTTEEQGYYDSIVRFQEAEAAGEKADSADYSQYMSRMVAIHKFQDEPANFLTPSYFETTDGLLWRRWNFRRFFRLLWESLTCLPLMNLWITGPQQEDRRLQMKSMRSFLRNKDA